MILSIGIHWMDDSLSWWEFRLRELKGDDRTAPQVLRDTRKKAIERYGDPNAE